MVIFIYQFLIFIVKNHQTKFAQPLCRSLVSVFAWAAASPFLERAMKCAGLGKAEIIGDIGHAFLRVAEKRDRQVATQVIHDGAIGLAFIIEPPALGRFRQMKLMRDRCDIRPRLRIKRAQVTS